jgi:hypothetical protein
MFSVAIPAFSVYAYVSSVRRYPPSEVVTVSEVFCSVTGSYTYAVVDVTTWADTDDA